MGNVFSTKDEYKYMMNTKLGRRRFITTLVGASLLMITGMKQALAVMIQKITLTEEEWQKKLTPEQFRILRKEGTEQSFTSPLNDEKRTGTFHCVGCDLLLFNSEQKYDSGTGWPSFFDTAIDGHVETKTDFKLIYPRKEYHCARCGGHQGHIFRDGPQPTGLRYCNNGTALYFKVKGTLERKKI